VTTVPPAAASIDAYFAANILPSQLIVLAQNLGGTTASWLLGYTQDDGTPVYQGISDPAQDPASASLAFGLVQQYGAVTIRGYSCTYEPPSPSVADVTLDDAQQAALNDPANWVTL
jgi:hypothetical protein